MIHSVSIKLKPPSAIRPLTNATLGEIVVYQSFEADSKEHAEQLAKDYIAPFIKLGVEVTVTCLDKPIN